MKSCISFFSRLTIAFGSSFSKSTLDEVIDQMKTVLWYEKNERMEQMNNELGM